MKRPFDTWLFVALLAAFLLLNAVLLGQAAAVARRTEIVAVPSTWRSTPSGWRAAYELLGRLGFRVGRLEQWPERLQDEISVLLIAEPALLIDRFQALALREWVDRGGTLILACEGVTGADSPVRELPTRLFLRRQGPEPWLPGDAGATSWTVGETGRYLSGVGRLELDPTASQVPSRAVLARSVAELTDRRTRWPLASPEWLGAVVSIGRGRVFVLATPALFANGQLARAGNARLLVNLVAAHAGEGRVMFDEDHLGNPGAAGLWQVMWQPPRRWLTLQLLLAAALLGWRSAVRFGPVLAGVVEPPRRPAVDGVRALANLYQRAGAAGSIARLLAGELRRRARPSPEREAVRAELEADGRRWTARELVALAARVDAMLDKERRWKR